MAPIAPCQAWALSVRMGPPHGGALTLPVEWILSCLGLEVQYRRIMNPCLVE
jgi:hypothetical protein